MGFSETFPPKQMESIALFVLGSRENESSLTRDNNADLTSILVGGGRGGGRGSILSVSPFFGTKCNVCRFLARCLGRLRFRPGAEQSESASKRRKPEVGRGNAISSKTKPSSSGQLVPPSPRFLRFQVLVMASENTSCRWSSRKSRSSFNVHSFGANSTIGG